jgi:hypothetical protein
MYESPFILTTNGFLPAGSGTITGHNTRVTHITQVAELNCVKAFGTWRIIGFN